MKILQITANFAPRGASPAIRTVNLAKALANAGHTLEVLTYSEEALTLFSPHDQALAAKVPETVRIHRLPAGLLRQRLLNKKGRGEFSIQQVKKSGSQSRLVSFLVPDPHIDAVASFIAEAARLVRKTKPDLVITHGYPFSFHFIGYFLKRRFPGLKWLADYGDPWSGAPTWELQRPQWRKRLDPWIERRMLKRADFVTVTTEPTRELYASLFPMLRDRISVVPMGYDADDFRVPKIEKEGADRDRIWLVHTGRLYTEARNPLPFIRALDELCAARPEARERLAVIMVGEVEPCLCEAIAASQSSALFRFIPWVPQEESLAWMKASDYLVLFGNRGEMQIPGKIYQYLGAQRPILLLYETLSDPTLKVVNEHNTLKVPNTVPQIIEALTGVMDGSIAYSMDKPELNLKYSWPEIVSDLFRFMAAAAEKDAPAGKVAR
jgi:glycosyltransferase involved in cell wall biosynthesis